MNPVYEAFYVGLTMYWIRVSVELPMHVTVEVEEVDDRGLRALVRYGRYAVEFVHPTLPTPHRVGVMIAREILECLWLAANHGEAGLEWPAVPVTDQSARLVRLYEFVVPASATTLKGVDFQRVA
jgi:hypothetical protein